MNPLRLIREAIKAVPAVRYALGVAGVAAVVAIVLGLKLSPQFAVFGTLVVLGLMFILVLFSQYAGAKAPTPGTAFSPIGVLVWFYTLVLVVVTSLFISSYFWRVPQFPFGTSSASASTAVLDQKRTPAADQLKPLFGPTPIDPKATYRASIAWVNLKRCQAEYCDVRVHLRAWATQAGTVLVDSFADVPSWSEGKPDSLTPQERQEGIRPVSMRYPNLEQGQITFLGGDTVMVQMGCDDSQGKAIFGAPRELDAHDLHSIFAAEADCGWVSLEMGFAISRGGKITPPKFPDEKVPPK